jgi:hypothetical protein
MSPGIALFSVKAFRTFSYAAKSFFGKVFFNPLLFASCTDTFIKWCKITRGMKRSAQ